MKVYVASSWRNNDQPGVVAALREAGHEVYDFRNPGPGRHGFAWSDIDPAWQSWTPDQFAAALSHPIAAAGFASDHAAMEWADAVVMVMPCGRSAHLELGWACGRGKLALVLQTAAAEPELMYLEAAAVCTSLDEVIWRLRTAPPSRDLLAGREMFRARLEAVDGESCSICGCTRNQPCEGGCWWVADNLCSDCQFFVRGADDGEGFVVVDRVTGEPLGDERGEVIYLKEADALAAAGVGRVEMDPAGCGAPDCEDGRTVGGTCAACGGLGVDLDQPVKLAALGLVARATDGGFFGAGGDDV